jgi:hypothetical protein
MAAPPRCWAAMLGEQGGTIEIGVDIATRDGDVGRRDERASRPPGPATGRDAQRAGRDRLHAGGTVRPLRASASISALLTQVLPTAGVGAGDEQPRRSSAAQRRQGKGVDVAAAAAGGLRPPRRGRRPPRRSPAVCRRGRDVRPRRRPPRGRRARAVPNMPRARSTCAVRSADALQIAHERGDDRRRAR